MKPFAEVLREQRRLVILRLLSERAGYRGNSSELTMHLQHIGVVAVREDVLADLDMLEREALVRVDHIETASLRVATLTQRGLEVSQGLHIVPGIARPSPR